jgi:hypothetical protein
MRIESNSESIQMRNESNSESIQIESNFENNASGRRFDSNRIVNQSFRNASNLRWSVINPETSQSRNESNSESIQIESSFGNNDSGSRFNSNGIVHQSFRNMSNARNLNRWSIINPEISQSRNESNSESIQIESSFGNNASGSRIGSNGILHQSFRNVSNASDINTEPRNTQNQSNTDGSDDVNSESNENGNSLCENCHRMNSNHHSGQNDEPYRINFSEHASDTIRRRKFKNIRISSSHVSICTLCTECKNHLTTNDNKEASKDENIWPSFIWTLLSNSRIHGIYGRMIWKFIPTKWRHWWINELKASFPIVFAQITIENPIPIFVDRTIESNEWKNDINSFDLTKIAQACNKHLMPKVMCPWGCTEYTHRCGYIPLDTTFQRYLYKCSIKLMSNMKKLSLILSSRDDYIRREGDEDCWLLNPEWKIKPSIIIVKGKGPMVLTCRDHDGGNKYYMIHPCRQPKHNLASDKADQLCHAVDY